MLNPVSKANGSGGPKRVYQILIEKILDRIRTGEIKPGDKLPPERQMAEDLGVSRATVREAIRAMEVTGLVVSRQGEGTFINRDYSLVMSQPMTVMYWLGGASVFDLHHFRQALEIESASLAAVNINTKQYHHLDNIVSEMAVSESFEEGAELDRSFHNAIAEASGNILLQNALASADALISDIRTNTRAAIIQEERGNGVLAFQHRQILNAIADEDSLLAAKRMYEHMLYVADFLPDMFSNNDTDLSAGEVEK